MLADVKAEDSEVKLPDELRSQPIMAGGTALLALVACFGFLATIYQLRETTAALKASTAYEIQKDARELIQGLRSHPDFMALYQGGQPKDRKQALLDVWLMINFHLSVFEQSQSGGLSADFSKAFAADFCGYLKRKPIAEAWDELVLGGEITEPQKKMRDVWCIAGG
jgi:hypothetical protein